MCTLGNILAAFSFTGQLASQIKPGSEVGPLFLFSPFKLGFLIVWIYLCLYCVQRIEFSPLVPERHKPLANLFALVLGPLLIFVYFMADFAKKLQDRDVQLVDIFRLIFGSTFRPFRGIRSDEPIIELLDSSGKSFAEVYGDQHIDQAESSEIRDFTEGMVLDAIKQTASDILVDPKSDGVFEIRFRVDGFLRNVDQFEADRGAAMVNSIKAISGMDIAERRRPQDGSFMAKTPQGNVFFRVASAGVLGGEKLSIRVLNQTAGLLKIDEVGFSESQLKTVTDIVSQSSGMILVCGPTGSGKTTSLYAMLSTIDFFARNVVTVEDPIEHVLPHASQIEVNVKANITFANALRSILRQDPDVICVGEIRDSETAAMALQSSQTGHLVLATLHSSSNLAALVRLMDLEIRPLLLASALSVIISQRLVRKLCEHCKSPAELAPEQIENFEKKQLDYSNIMQPNGCKYCHHTGYSGRTGIFDVLFIDENLKASLLQERLSLSDLKTKGDEKARSALKQHGIQKVLDGVTTINEVKRVTTTLG